MSHYLLELALWMLLALFIGCIIGCLLRKMFGNAEVATPNPAAQAEALVSPQPAALEAKTQAMPEVGRAPKAPAAPVTGTGKMERPKGISAARGGKADSLQKISGVGPKNEKVLHKLGFFHFEQIAAWTAEEIEWVDDHLKFNGRIKREEWTRQAKLLAAGNEKEFNKLYGTGGMKNTSGQTVSGTRTRKT